jgi:hypothetical protein
VVSYHGESYQCRFWRRFPDIDQQSAARSMLHQVSIFLFPHLSLRFRSCTLFLTFRIFLVSRNLMPCLE